MMMLLLLMFVLLNVAGVMMILLMFVLFLLMFVDINVAGMMMMMVLGRRVMTVDVIATSDDFSRGCHCKGGEKESNEDFELHICLRY